MAVGMTEMGKFYNLPVYINVGLTDSKIPDAQAGIEAGITLACGAMAGADIFGHLGIAGVDQAASLSMLIMQHELIGYVERLVRGVDVTDDTLGLDVIEHGMAAGSFLAEEHTARHFRQELWFPQLLDRRFWEAWAKDGARDMASRCMEMKNRILREHVPTPMPDDMLAAVDALCEDAKRHLAK
jgi:trimethylamine--corrinoid protein Co-methyltransferase